MDRKYAIPVNNGLLDEHFGHCRQFVLIEVEDGKVSREEVIDAPPHQPGLLPPFLAEKGVTDVITGGIGQRAIQIFNQYNVNVFCGAPKKYAKELVEGHLNGTIQFSDNYCDH